MIIKTFRFKSAKNVGIVLALAGGSFYFAWSNIFWSLSTNVHDDAKLYAPNLSMETNTSDMLSQSTGIDDNDNVTTSEALTQDGGKAVRHHVSYLGNSRQQDVPSINNTKIIINNATINATYNYTQRVGPSRNDYRESRSAMFDSWFKDSKGKQVLIENADKNGPILDFVIAGYPKCGTTTVQANLAHLAPMNVGDICTPPSPTVYYAYQNWPDKYGKQKPLRGSKCPLYLESTNMKEFSKSLPRTKIIIGIRHPILWFQSFWNMQAGQPILSRINNDPYALTEPCRNSDKQICRNSCPNRLLFCMHRGRFHLPLATLGKTALSEEERKLLAPNDKDGGERLNNWNIRNPIFLYEQNELKKDYVWDEMAKYLNVTTIPRDTYVSSHGRQSKGGNRTTTNFCEERLDGFRAMMMPYSYELSVWMQDYFIPVAKNENSDVTIPNPNAMIALVEEYKKDPCGRLYRLENGTYVLNRNGTIIIEI